MNEAPQPPTPEHHETEPNEQPRIYVASLSDYNAGILHGTWLDADDDIDDLQAGVQAMLATSPSDPRAEEYAIHDYEGFYGLRIDEYEPLERVNKVAQGIKAHGEAIAVWIDNDSTNDPDGFEDAYLGRWDSVEDYAAELLEDLGIDTDALGPDNLQPYIRFDLEGFARDLASELGVIEGRHGVYVFEQ